MDRNVVVRPIGDWLVEWGMISEKQLQVALNDARVHSLPVGMCLILREQVDTETIQSAVIGQSYLRDGAIKVEEATNAMALVKRKHVSLGIAFNLLAVQPQSLPRNRLGDLLLASGAISSGELKVVLSLAKSTGLPLGRILLNHGSITEDLIQTALLLQTTIRRGEIDRNTAIEKLSQYVEDGARNSILAGIGLHAETLTGSLLVKSGVISEVNIKDALNTSVRAGARLGEVLVSKGMLRREMVESTLEVQKLIRSHKFTVPQGLSVLRNVHAAQRRDEIKSESGHHGQRTKPLVMSFYRYLKLTRALPDVILRGGVSHDALTREAVQSEMEMTWQELRAVSPLAEPVVPCLPEDVRSLLQRCGFITDEQLVIAQRAAYTYKLVLDQVLSIEQALIEFHRLKMEEVQPKDWTGTFPNLSAI
ncbi:MAG: hypothetical protein C0469_15655 [Cyanobacteria bacterium DS2.3.42]|nr:hypothetical protein [Cyanobacteria bacterium DS2.3.42]